MTKITAVVSPDTAAALKELARVQDRSVGSIVRLAIAAHIARPDAIEDVPAAVSPAADGKDGQGQ